MIVLIQFIQLDTRPVKKHSALYRIEITRWLGSGPVSEQTSMKIIESVGIQYYSYDTKYDRKL